MPDVTSSHLRIYCICGQKMKISEKMFGLPGKCIACRQKIRIPNPDDIPEGTVEIYLKDYPELLRGPKRKAEDIAREREAQEALDAARPQQSLAVDSTPITELDLVEGTTPQDRRSDASSLPIDALEPLRVLCSLRHKFERQLETLEAYHHDDDTLIAEVEGHLARVRSRRTELDDYLHQLLMEAAIELANTQEKIAQSRLAARVGETTFDEHQKRAYRLRTRRDRLERRQQNLRGWLATTDPYVAGGFLDLSVDRIPEEGAKISVPAEPEESDSLLNAHIAGMREALNRRARAEQKLEEAERIAAGDSDSDSLDESRQECRRAKRMARAAVTFYLGRLERMDKDYQSDLETIKAQMEAMRDRLKLGEIDRGEFDATERALLRAKKDITRARTVVARGLAANAPSDVPRPQGTFLERLGVSGQIGPKPDIWVAWLSALALAVGIVLPTVGDLSLIAAFSELQGTSAGAWVFLGPLTIASAAAAVTAFPQQATRGGLLLAIWCVGMAVSIYVLFLSLNSLDPMAARFRAGDAWFMRPGIWLLDAGLFGVACAAVIALWPSRAFRPVALLVVALGMLSAALVPSDVAGAMAPRPVVDVVLEAPQENGDQAGTIRITNLGRRSLHLVSRAEDGRSSYLLVMERRIGEDSWSDVGLETAGAESDLLIGRVGANETYDVPFVVGPGEYQALLLSNALNTEVREHFTVAAPVVPEPEPEPEPVAIEIPAEESAPPETDRTPEPAEPPATRTEVELQGIMMASEGATRFSFIIYLPDGTLKRMTLSLGQVLWGEWEVSEYNRSFSTVTLQRGNNLLILRRGARNSLAQ